MRTKGQQVVNDTAGDAAMMIQIKTILHRQQATILQDAVGAAALAVILVVGLHLPGLI